MSFNWHKTASLSWFYSFSGKVIPWLAVLCVLLFGYGLFVGLVVAPPDYQQGDVYRIMYVHVPNAILSMMTYTCMAICAFIGLVWRIKLANIFVRVAAPLGAWFTLVALVTGSIWGKPTWGTYWVWDARLTSELLLLFLYIGYLALYNAFANKQKAVKVSNIFLLIGFIDIPIIHYSVDWWNTLHQGASLSLTTKPTIHGLMLYPLLAMITGFIVFALMVVWMRARNAILLQDYNSKWVKELIK